MDLESLRRGIRKNLVFFVLSILFSILALSLDMFNPRIVQEIIDGVIIGGRMEDLSRLLLFLSIITLSRVLLGYGRGYFMDLGGSALASDIRVDLLKHLQTLPLSFFDQINTGELMSRIKEDIDNVWFTFGFALMFFVEQVLLYYLAGIILFGINRELTLLIVLLLPIIGYIAYKLEVRIDKVYGEISDQGVRLNTTAQEDIAGIRVVKSFGRERHEIEKFFRENHRNYELNVKQAKTLASYGPWMDFLTNISIAIAITIGGLFVIRETMSVGTLVAFSTYVSMLVWPMRMLGWLINALSQCRASLKKIDRFFKEKPEREVIGNPVMLKEIRGNVSFRDVSFKYKDEYVLKNINFELKEGKTLAIMGTTGSGKTTLINLIGRFYEPWEGEILLDGVDIKNISLEVLRSAISYVPQDVFLFSDTVLENIRLGSQVPEEEIIKALETARAYNFVMNLPEGLDTIVGERGLGLSGGQKQRLSIARALVRRARILILDDVTSSLDMETEHYVQRAIEKHYGDFTKIIIAHRVSAVKNADEIIILENGEIVERGTHQELLALRGRYFDIYQEQYGKYILDFEEEMV